jgi:cytoskeleton protein RodZ
MSEPSANEAGPAMSAGARLAKTRERLGLSQEQVADKLKLDTYTVAALEAGDYRVIGAAVFVRGFLRRYAQLVGESPAEIEVLYARQPESSLAPDLARVPVHAQLSQRPRKRIGIWPAVVGAVLLCAFGAWRWAMHRAAPARSDSTVEIIESPGEVAGTAPAAPAAAAPAPAPAGAVAVASAPAAPASPEAEAAALAVRLAALPRKHLTLRVNDESWVEVYDARGMRLQFGFAHAGSAKELTGTPPFRLVLGNSSAVELALEGAAVSLPQAAPGARLRVTVSGKGIVTLRP